MSDTRDIQPTFRDFYLAMSREQRAQFAALAGTTEAYISVKYVRAASVPRPEQMQRLWVACKTYGAPFTRADLLRFFYPEGAYRVSGDGRGASA